MACGGVSPRENRQMLWKLSHGRSVSVRVSECCFLDDRKWDLHSTTALFVSGTEKAVFMFEGRKVGKGRRSEFEGTLLKYVDGQRCITG